MAEQFLADFPAYLYGYVKPFVVDENSLAQADGYLREYEDQFRKLSDQEPQEQPYPWRRVITLTGLPAFIRGYFRGTFPAESGVPLAEILAQWEPSSIRETLFGTAELDLDNMFIPLDLASVNLTDGQSIRNTVHVPYQQYVGEYPIFGAEVVAHLAQDTPRASLTSSYLAPTKFETPRELLGEAQIIELATDWFINYYLPAQQATPDKNFPNQSKDDWSAIDLVPYAGQPRFVYPFRGAYRVACQVEFVNSEQTLAWRVIVDAETGTVLGWPIRVAHGATYFASSADALLPHLSSKPLAGNPAQTFLQVGNGAVPDWVATSTSGNEQELVNVAVNADHFHQYFSSLLNPATPNTAAKLNQYTHPTQGGFTPGLRAEVTTSATNVESALFNSAFLVNPKVVSFRQSEANGIVLGSNPPIHTPAFDPEVIYHELTHAFMWLLKADQPNLFDWAADNLPFVNALTEGLATYFARSFAAPADATSTAWASAAYRDGDWGERWKVPRTTFLPGADYLPQANRYPFTTTLTSDLHTYDVGMVLVRGLWELHKIYGPTVLDPLVLDAYFYLHGWIANFELAAEGLMDAAAKVGTLATFEKDAQSKFVDRRILANQSIQALLHTPTTAVGGGANGAVILVGSDAGLMRSLDNGETWANWDQVIGGGLLRNVVALTHANDTFYAATETQLYRRPSDDSQLWQVLATLPTNQSSLLSLCTHADFLYVGTGDNLWMYDLTNSNWTWVNDPAQLYNAVGSYTPFLGEPLQAVGVNQLAVAPTLFAAGFTSLSSLAVADLATAAWASDQFISTTAPERLGAFASDGRDVYIGVLESGIFVRLEDRTISQIATNADLGQMAVVSLVWDNQTLWVGTTGGLFAGVKVIGGATWNWQPIATTLPSTAVIQSVLPIANNDLLVNTTTEGLWRSKTGIWARVVAVDGLVH